MATYSAILNLAHKVDVRIKRVMQVKHTHGARYAKFTLFLKVILQPSP